MDSITNYNDIKRNNSTMPEHLKRNRFYNRGDDILSLIADVSWARRLAVARRFEIEPDPTPARSARSFPSRGVRGDTLRKALAATVGAEADHL